jgi:glycine hydroxymethyltransferase
MEAAGSVLTNKYAKKDILAKGTTGCEVVDVIEQITIDRAKELFGAAYAKKNVQLTQFTSQYCGLSCLVKPGDKILGFDLHHGGHLTHELTPVNFSGRLYTPSFYGVDKETELDYDKIQEIT